MKYLYLILLMPVLFACTNLPDDIIFSWGDTNVHCLRDAAPDSLSGNAFRYPAWKGERAFAEAVLWSGHSLSDITVKVSDLRGNGNVISSEAIQAQFVRYVWADEMIEGYGQCGYRPKGQQDSLLVADMVDIASSTDLEAGTCLPIWVTVSVPSDAAPGIYRGTLTVKARHSAKMRLPVELEVTGRVLPQPEDWKFRLDLWQNPYSVARYHGVELWSKEHFDYMRPVMQMLADAGQKAITTTILDRPWNGQTEDAFGSMVTKTLKKDGSWEYGYEIFDKWVEFMMSLGIDETISCYSLIPWHLEFDYLDEVTNSMKSLKAEPSSVGYKLYWGNFISDFAAHLREKGWFEKTCLAMDERPAEAMRAAFELIRSVEPDFRVSLAGNWHPEIESELYDYCVAFRQDMPDDIKQKRSLEGKVSTYYTCCAERYPNLFTVSPLSEAVWIPFYAMAKGYDGYLRWAYNHWTAEPMSDTRFRTWTAGDCYCVYPEGRGSLRFFKLAEGIQDYEKLRILKEEWQSSGRTELLKQLDTVLSRFDYETITDEGAAPAVKKAKEFINASSVISK
ncbi:MAG: DUF4091 domain-containing protein [Clostridium sp.]|nr:DUF4091 domain-containing protein [Bacteroides sp.]MCM1198046.1 DUF4091 domain-containing protein [Clostridium sp.]